MCSVGESDAEHYMERKTLPIRNGEICRKCGDLQAQVVLRVKDCYCRNCFLAAATHKFRSALGKSKLVRPADHILIAFSGSASSLSMVHLTHAGKNEQNHKRFLFSISVAYIDEGVVSGMNQEERKSTCETINCLIKKFGFPIYISTLSESLDVGNNRSFNNFDSSYTLPSNEKDEELKRLFNSVKNLTQKDDLLQALRTRLLIRIAKQLQCTKIFTAETGTHLSVKLLSNVSLGRGAHIPLDVGFCDGRDPKVKVLRPMREFMKKEIMFYNVFHNLEPLCLLSLSTKAQPHASIQKLTEKFITELQEDFPSTVSTILRTGDKLSAADTSANPERTCALCEAPLDMSTSPSSAQQAIEFSRMVSILGPEKFDMKSVGMLVSTSQLSGTHCLDKVKSCCGTASDCCNGKTKNEALSLSEAEPWLCYGCRLIVRSMLSLKNLPSEVEQKIRNHKRREEMRQEIEDYLL